MAALRMVPIGLAMPIPAISGADPCIGSYRPEVGLKSAEGAEGAPASDAEGRRPREPGITLDWSERLEIVHEKKSHKMACKAYMSPNKFSVRITPLRRFGLATMTIAAESTNW